MELVHVEESDFEEILALNRVSVPHVNAIGSEGMRWFGGNAVFFKRLKLKFESPDS